MTYLPLFLTAELDLSEKLALSGEMLLRGMGTVFLVLIILWAIISLFGRLVGGQQTEKEAKEAPKKVAPKKAEAKKEAKAPVAQPAAVPVQAAGQDDSLIAAIIAAVEAYRAEEGLSSLPYRVVSFKRKSGRKSWNGNFED
ncbi:MAG: hypothetical protein E7672_07960 [Ruminococcaceae bacterium]|nr:hypothetical protein [Oscillospiraceae bacterium]